MRTVTLLSCILMLGLFQPATADPVFRKAENDVQMAVVEVSNFASYTEVRLQAQAATQEVCWYSKGPNSPYLVAGGRRYRFVGGDAITGCPARRNYAAGESMVLRFEPLDPQVRDVSLVEGEGGENQMRGSSSGEQFWNFLNIRLR